jgi:SAM-dependent MidA family methyltransferase
MWLSWRVATERALYAERGFYRRTELPARHFRTSVHASPVFARAILALLAHVDKAMGHPAALDVVDVGAGGGELLGQLHELAPDELAGRLRLTAVEIRPRPDGLPDAVSWVDTVPAGITGLVMANEWLDNVPVDVVEQTTGRLRLVLVDPATGNERLGGRPTTADVRWLATWWAPGIGERAEVGRPRDEAWVDLLGHLANGYALAVDFHHHRTDRPPGGTVAGYRGGRWVSPVPDGSCDICAHVALDACAAAGERFGANDTVLTTQRDALLALGIDGQQPELSLADRDPVGYLRAQRLAGEAAELLDPAGLGGFGWLFQAVAPNRQHIPARWLSTVDHR